MLQGEKKRQRRLELNLYVLMWSMLFPELIHTYTSPANKPWNLEVTDWRASATHWTKISVENVSIEKTNWATFIIPGYLAPPAGHLTLGLSFMAVG